MHQMSREELERQEREIRKQAAAMLRKADQLRAQALALADEASRIRQQLGYASCV